VFDYYCPVWANVSISGISNIKNSPKRAAKILLGPLNKILRYHKAVNINGGDVQRKNVVNNVDKSSLWAP